MINWKSKNKLLIYISLFLIFSLFISLNSFDYLRSSITDNLQGGKQTLDNIVIITIDDESINKIGRWPWDRQVFAEILKKTKDARVIGLDVSFFEPSNNDQELNQTINSMNNLLLASEINQGVLYKPIFESSTGYVNLLTDSRGITRGLRADLSSEIKPFAFVVFENAYSRQIDYKQKYFINFASEPGAFEYIKAHEVLDNDFDFSNKIVLIGATAPNLHDNYFVPTSNSIAMPGVEIHANIIQNLILENFLKKQSRPSILFFVLIFSIANFFFISKLRTSKIILITITTTIFYLILAIFLFNNFNYVLDLFFGPITIFIFLGTGLGVNYFEEKKHSSYLTDAFGRYISKDLLSDIITKKQQLKLGGAKREITVFFSDIRSFTSISEKLSPEELVQLINEYLTEMTKIILEHKGTVDKFIGDAIMAFWNAPLLEKEHALLACKSAIAQVKALEKLQESFLKRNLPKIEIGCGLHTGEAIIGNMGSEDRFDYTAMGDTVNLGSRLEGLTKQYGVHIIISESTYKQIKGKLPCRKLDKVKVKGKKIPITIYELVTNEDKKFTQEYEKALELYLNKKFSLAEKLFEKANSIKKDVSAELFINRCKEYIQNPPALNWDGAFEMKTK